jgi:hypothetical protein
VDLTLPGTKIITSGLVLFERSFKEGTFLEASLGSATSVILRLKRYVPGCKNFAVRLLGVPVDAVSET